VTISGRSPIAAAAKQARIPLREADLKAVRTLVLVSPPESFAAEDRAVLDGVLATRRPRLVQADADLGRLFAARQLHILGWEGPLGAARPGHLPSAGRAGHRSRARGACRCHPHHAPTAGHLGHPQAFARRGGSVKHVPVECLRRQAVQPS